ncbi:putative thioredoxin [Kalaharituber pfeilii]|nr:putative thioredoxin [Kalaharituber pfeilii]
MPVQSINSETEYLAALKTDKLVVIDFYATWCGKNTSRGPCIAIAPVIETYSKSSEYQQVSFYKLDTEEVKDVTEKLRITAIPTFIFFKDGNVVKRSVGADAHAIKGILTQLTTASNNTPDE